MSILFLFILIGLIGFAQAPQLLHYQGVARNAFGNAYSNKTMTLRLSIRTGTNTGAVVYSETRLVKTNDGGLYTVEIGSTGATSTTGTIGSINWQTGTKYLQVEADPAAGSNFIDLGTTQFLSVPYAFGAGSAATVTTNANLTGVVTSVGNQTSIANGAITSDMIASINQSKVGLGLVNNTSDAAKPISTAMQAALDLKASAIQLNDLSANLNNKLNIADSTVGYVTPTQLASKTFDQTPINNAISGKLNIADSLTKYITPAQLAGYNFSSGGGNSNSNNSSSNLSFLAPLSKSGNDVSISAASGSVNGYLSAADFTNFSNKIDASQKAANNGVATLGNDGKIPSTQIPAVSFQSANVVSSQAAMLGLSNAQVGSIAIRTDNNNNYVLSALPATTLSNWIQLATPNSVTSVNGNAGPNVTLTTSDVAEGTNKFYTDARVRAALSATSPLVMDATNGNISIPFASSSANGYLKATDFATFNNKQNTLSAGVDYLAPNGSAASLTNFPTLNQNTTGTAANVSGTVGVANGGTGATTLSGIVKGNGTGAMTAAVAGTDYLAPNGSAASLTNFPTFNQNTTGTAANVSGTVGVANGGTGATILSGIVKGNGTGAMTAAVAGTDYLAPNGSAASLTNFPTLNQNTTGNAATVTTNANLTGDVTSVGNASTVVKINGTSLAGLSTGILKNTTSTGVPTIAVAGTDYQAPISLTTTGSGAATLSGNTLNIPSGTNYTLPTASSSALGGVKVGNNLSIDGSGVLSANITAGSISGTIAIANGGTGASTQQDAINSLTGTQALGKFLRSDGTNATLANIQAADVPTLNQNTTGNAATVTTNANLTGDVTSIGNASTVVKINGTSLAGLSTGILKNTTSTGVPTIAVSGTDYQAPISLTTTGTGAATLSGNTLNIPSSTNYTLPTASSSALGGVKVGTNLSIDGSGVLNANISGKMDIADTASMLSNYRTGLNNKLNYTDTSTMLSSYLRKMDTASLSNRINVKFNTSDTSSLNLTSRLGSKLNYSDTAGMLLNYKNSLASKFNTSDTSSLNLTSRLGSKLNYSDTSIMLNPYLRKTDNAATATLAGNITATSNTTLTSLSNLNTVGTITSGTMSLTTNISTTGTLKAGPVTYPNTHGTSGQVLTSLASGTLSWTTASSGGGLPTTGNTTGDMLYWNGTAWVKVAAGTSGQTLTYINNVPTWYGGSGTVVSTTGKIWMDRDLGASRVATSSTDYLAYGSIYQWGRGNDGHQLINFTSATAGSAVNTFSATQSSTDIPANVTFYAYCTGTYDWLSTKNDLLWQGVNGKNNPCPSVFRLPTETEWTTEYATWAANSSGAFSSVLKIPLAGIRSCCGGGLALIGTGSIYWSSTVTGTQARTLYYGPWPSTTVGISNSNRADGRTVRCIKD